MWLKSIASFLFLIFLTFEVMGMPTSQVATFAGGCFWCMQPAFDSQPGVIKTVVGYAGGAEPNPTYEQVSAGTTGYREAIQVTFDPEKISYPALLTIFWHNIDPTDSKGQFCDKGMQYLSAIYFHDEAQMAQALASHKAIIKEHRFTSLYTQILPFTTFYPAEEYHQDYYKKNPIRYKFYRYSCGRDKKLEELWKPKT